MFYDLPPRLESEIAELERKILDFRSGRITPTELRAYRVPFGIYEQRKNNTYMMRIRCTGGALTPAQLRVAAQLAREYGSSILHVTTRQELQIHDLELGSIIPIMRTLKEAGLSTRGGGGNTVRNIVASPSAGVDPAEPFDISPYVFALTSRLLAEPDSWLLPRKLKIAFSNSPADTAQAAFQDIGFIATERDQPGFAVYVAGGLGAKPAVAHRIHDFIPAEEVHLTVEAIKRLYAHHGNRRNKHRNRLRFLWSEMRESNFLDSYRSYRNQLKSEGPSPLRPREFSSVPATLPLPLPVSTEAFNRWKNRHVFPEKKPAFRQILIPLVHGDLPSNQALQLADFLEPFGPDTLRGTRDQNLLLRHIPETHLGNLFELVREWNPLIHAAPFLARSVVCTGAATCRLGICLPRPAIDAIQDELLKANLPLDELEDFQMNISGCPNSCGNHWTADLGFFGKAARKGDRLYPAYNIVSGGCAGGGEAMLAENMGEIASKHLPVFVREFIAIYLNKKARFARFRSYFEAEGRQDIKTLLHRFSFVPDFSVDTGFYVDWGEGVTFSMIDRGQGECSAGLFDLIESDLKRAEEILEQLERSPHAADFEKSLYQAVLFTSRSLLITRGEEPREDSQTLDLFIRHFLDTGLVDECFRPLLMAALERHGDMPCLLASGARALYEAVKALYHRMDDRFQFMPEKNGPEEGKQQIAPVPEIPLKDLRGVACPMNFVKAKIALDALEPGQLLGMLLDNGAPIENVPRSIQNEGHKIMEQTARGDHWYILVEKRR